MKLIRCVTCMIFYVFLMINSYKNMIYLIGEYGCGFIAEIKKIDTKALLERSRNSKQSQQGKFLKQKLKNKKNSATFGKVNFNG